MARSDPKSYQYQIALYYCVYVSYAKSTLDMTFWIGASHAFISRVNCAEGGLQNPVTWQTTVDVVVLANKTIPLIPFGHCKSQPTRSSLYNV